MSKKYIVEIYTPNSANDVWALFESDTPFMAISKGDILNPALLVGSQSPMKVCRVINVEHILWDHGDGVKHKILIFTEEVEGTQELRLMR